MDEFEVDDAYCTALEFLLAGTMPVVVEAGDYLHVLGVKPNSLEQVEMMINPDVSERLRFIVATTRAIKKHCEEEALA